MLIFHVSASAYFEFTYEGNYTGISQQRESFDFNLSYKNVRVSSERESFDFNLSRTFIGERKLIDIYLVTVTNRSIISWSTFQIHVILAILIF